MISDPVAEPEALSGLSALVLLDVRDADAFATDHLPGAVRVPIEDWVAAAKAEDSAFGNVGWWEAQIRALGIGEDTTAAVFDDGRMTEAARVWFILQHLGARAVIVNGGLPALAASAPRLDLAGAPSAPFVARPGSGPLGLVDRHTLRESLGEVAVFDSRTEREFTGEDRKANARGGHLPGARLLPHGDLLDGTRLKSPDALRELITQAGFRPGDRIVTHCDGGGRAALAAVAALRSGFVNAYVYYLSFADWAQDESCPLE